MNHNFFTHSSVNGQESRNMILMNLTENGLADTAREGEVGTSWESGIDIYTLSCGKIISGKLLNNTHCPGALWWPIGVGCGAQVEREIMTDLKLLYDRNQHKICKAIFPLIKKNHPQNGTIEPYFKSDNTNLRNECLPLITYSSLMNNETASNLDFL